MYTSAGILSRKEVGGPSVSMPDLTQGMVGLLAISNGSYLGAKVVDHTKT
jgi:hypothetical protein